MADASTSPDLWQTFARNCRIYGERIATHFQGNDRTYADLRDRAVNLAQALHDSWGIGRGDVIAVASLNRPEILEAILAVARLGAIVTILNTRLVPQEANEILSLSGAKVVIAEPQFGPHVEATGLPVIAFTQPWPTGLRAPAAEYETLVSGSAAQAPAHEWAGSAPLLMQFTSGSTGTPKPVLLSQSNLLWDAIGQSQHLRLRAGDRQLLGTPMCWTGGSVLVTQAFLLNGYTIDILPSWSATAAVEAIVERGCNVMGSFPLLVRDLMDGIKQAGRGGGLRVLVCGGGAHTTEFDAEVMEVLAPENYLFIYGLTESTGPAAYTGATQITLAKPLGLGFPAWYLDYRIADKDGNDVPVGEPGELLLKGPTITTGETYIPGRAGPNVRDGWLHTGDLVRQDADGCIFFVDRVKDMIKTGGLNVYAAEVEQAIVRNFGGRIADVAVVGVPSRRWGEAVVAAVELATGASLDEAELLAGLREILASYKLPKRVEFVPSLARTATGKIDKPSLRLTMAEVGHEL